MKSRKLLLNHGFTGEGKLSKKTVMFEEELDGTDIDDTGNLEDSPRLVFINEECENLIVFNDGGELTRILNQKKKLDVLP